MLQVCGAIDAKENDVAKRMLDRIAAMLTKLGGRGYSVGDDVEGYGDPSE